MFTVTTNGSTTGQSRREFLRVGGLASLGLTLPQWLNPALASTDRLTDRRIAKSCILVWLDGGPSHIDTFDPKPLAPEEVRGPFSSIATSIPGVTISELFPQMAKRLHKCTLIRSLTSPLGEHNLGAHYMLTGYRPSEVIEYPTWQSVVQQHTSSQAKATLPQFVAVPNFNVGGGRITSQSFLPAEFAPFSVNSDPAKPDFSVTNLTAPENLSGVRLQRRQSYLQWLDSEQKADPLTQQAFRLLQSNDTQVAFDLRQESADVRSRYGMKSIGQSCLLARRLVERGVPLVSVVDHGWDTHADVVNRLRDGYVGAKVPVGLGPSLDQALSALIDDLDASGLLNETLVVVMGEFGRTPKWNSNGGRDHWPRAFSVLLAGGPICRGSVFGSSDRYGEGPQSDPVTPADLTHTIYRALGIDPQAMLHSPDGRPIRITDDTSRVITEVFG